MKLLLIYTVLNNIYAMTDTPSPSVTGTSSQSQSGSGSPSETANNTIAVIDNNVYSVSASNGLPTEAAIYIGFISIPIAAVLGYVGFNTLCNCRKFRKLNRRIV
jgi:hypothetical protein